ncbi:K02A2.6-like [Cordylochernes scorpioides]|uniref:K02A2.6-like n=1 Tax=Cordylochernes scorpioides TaxID=51811 RepID=A0ABY6L1V1_9ARAC|nr:K02A2.6-like [Cordylochernes scorpioides]
MQFPTQGAFVRHDLVTHIFQLKVTKLIDLTTNGDVLASPNIIELTDYYTRYAETIAVSEATVKEVSKFLVENIFLRHGAPQYLISDRGSKFTSNLMKEVMKMCKIKHCFTTSYHPQTNGLTAVK